MIIEGEFLKQAVEFISHTAAYREASRTGMTAEFIKHLGARAERFENGKFSEASCRAAYFSVRFRSDEARFAETLHHARGNYPDHTVMPVLSAEEYHTLSYDRGIVVDLLVNLFHYAAFCFLA